VWREAEEWKEAGVWKVEVGVWKVEAEWREHLARDKVALEVAVAEEQQQSLTMGLSGLKLTILAPASIARMASGSLTQSKGKRKRQRRIHPHPSTFCYSFFFHR
jgi:hypothetical protein